MEEKEDILKVHVTSNFKKEVPSFDFTELVMHKIEESIVEEKIIAPLISNQTWRIVFAIAFIILLGSFYLDIKKVEIHLFDNFSLPKISDFIVSIKLFFAISFVLGAMTVADLFYRKSKHLA